ncbi:MAG: SpoIIE family protein phosphatase [Trueperaceae bacterium]|nr:SpoIIE family protein phosphatase [Trueperaceae bacterium]
MSGTESPHAAPERYELKRPLDLQLAVLRSQRSALLQGASEQERSVIGTIVSELASNVLKYGTRGWLELRRLPGEGATQDAFAIEILVNDEGPGIADVARAFEDHYSTGHTLGLGLPGVRRMADEVEIRSRPGGGTVVHVRKYLRGDASGFQGRFPPVHRRTHDTSTRWEAASVVRPRTGRLVSGDDVVVIDQGARLLLAMMDATGHGAAAHRVARTLAAEVAHHAEVKLDTLMAQLHRAALGTVGAAVALALLDTQTSRMRYLAVGNARAARIGGGHATSWRGVSRGGIVGRRWPTPFVQSLTIAPGDVIALWTDGLHATAGRTAQGLLGSGDLLAVADAVVQDHARPHDDAAFLLARWRA